MFRIPQDLVQIDFWISRVLTKIGLITVNNQPLHYDFVEEIRCGTPTGVYYSRPYDRKTQQLLDMTR